MPALRVRVESAPPLPPLKAWFPLNEDQYETVLDLQVELCSRLRAKYSEIVLMLDGYELFTGSNIRDVVRDGELIVVRSTHKLTKRVLEPEPERPRKRARLPPAAKKSVASILSDSSSSSSSSSDSSLEDDSSDSDSSSDSSSDSDSELDSTSSSDSGPSVQPTTKSAAQLRKQVHKPTPTTATTSKPRPSTPTVPPGHGKPSTQSRNARRRKKREFERVAQSAPIAGASAANSTPLGEHSIRPTSTEPTLTSFALAVGTGPSAMAAAMYPPASDDQPEMLSLSNKNKRRGFKRAMANIPPSRITFDDPDAPSSSTPPQASTSRPASPSKQPRLIPPSEKAALGQLPPGMFVTSVDVEAGQWPSTNKTFDKKRKKKQRDAWGQEQEYIPAAREQPQEQEGDWDGELPYDVEEDIGGVKAFLEIFEEVSGLGKKVKEEMLDWADVEARFESAQPVVAESLKVGSVVAWKEFGVHPVQLTPEMVVHAATVEAVDPVTGKVSIRATRREAAFGMPEEEEGEPEVVEYDLGALGQLGWKSM